MQPKNEIINKNINTCIDASWFDYHVKSKNQISVGKFEYQKAKILIAICNMLWNDQVAPKVLPHFYPPSNEYLHSV